MKKAIFYFGILFPLFSISQPALEWKNMDAAYAPLPSSVHIFFTSQQIDTAPFRAFYLVADLKNKHLDFTVDTTLDRRLTPAKFFEKNESPLVVVNGTFFSFETNRNLNAVVKEGKLVSYNTISLAGKGKDTLTFRHPFASAIGISKKRTADVAWTLTDPVKNVIYASQSAVAPLKDSVDNHSTDYYLDRSSVNSNMYESKNYGTAPVLKKWQVKTAIGGGPVLLQNSKVAITNNEEVKFTGKAISDKHPRTAMGYTKDNQLIILVIEGRNKIAHGATLKQEAQILQDLHCAEALNLDGGGSSCLLINGKQTIQPSDSAGQRPVPAVFIIKAKK